MQLFLCITNDSIKHQLFVYIQLIVQTVLFLTIQTSIRYLFALTLNVKQFYLTHRWDPFRCYHSGPEWIWEWWQWKGTPHPLKGTLHIIGFFSVISKTLIAWGRGFYYCAGMQSRHSTAPVDWATINERLTATITQGQRQYMSNGNKEMNP